MRNNFIIVLINCLTVVACSQKNTSETATNFTLKGDTIIVGSDANLLEKLKIVEVKEEEYSHEMITAGTVKAIPYLFAEIAPPFSGRVTKVYLRLGMKTQPGTILFEMVSPEFTDAQKLYFQAKSELENAKLTLKRQQDLKANGVGAERDLEEAQTNYQVKEKEYQNAVASLKIFGVDVDKLVLGQPLVVTSPIEGEVIENEVVNGHFIRADDPPHAKVAELSKVWVAGMVKEKDIRIINSLEGAEILIAAYPNKKIIGKIFHIDKIIDEETRSVRILIECDNTEQILRPGMYVTVKFIDHPKKTIFIPANSVLQFNDKSFVFVQVGKGVYVKRFVETGTTVGNRIQIVNGLTPSETVVGEGAFYLLEAK